MKLERLARFLLDLPDPVGNVSFSGIAADSREIQPGDLFFALPGSKDDGARYAKDAVAKGAVAIVTGKGAAIGDLTVPVIHAAEPRLALAQAAAEFFPDQPQTMAAVTGTAGKTSVATFLRQIWERDGKRAASLGTTGVVAPGREDYGNLTTPDPVSLHRLLDELCKDGVTHLSMEASSHGLDQKRLHGVRLSVAGFTNLGRDHMDYHPSVEHYLDAKLRLFRELLPKGFPAVIYADDAFSEPVEMAAREAGNEILTVGRKGTFISLKKVEHRQFSQVVEIAHDGEFHILDFPLAGDFQIANGLVASGMAIATGTPPAVAFSALESLQGACGRLELVGKTRHGCPVYVDYAHKPEALENVLLSLRPFASGRLVVVFGCGGDRDPGKRPIMGEIACRLADKVIVTDDNPRTEDPASIRAAILASCPGAEEIGDRAEAISSACALLEQGDCLVIAGKGHEPGQTIGDRVFPFSDHEEVRKCLEMTDA